MKVLKAFLSTLFLIVLSANVRSDDALQITPDLIMTGSSNLFMDGVWLRTGGQIAHVNCYYAQDNASLFYVKPNSSADSKKILAILLTAKIANRKVNIQYDSNGASADFSGYGISRCEIQKLIMN